MMKQLETIASQGVGHNTSLFWQRPSFLLFWGGQSLSNLGDAFALVAIPLLVLQVTGSAAQMGLVTATFGAGRLLAGVFAGLLVDRVDRRMFMIACDAGRLLLFGSIPCVWLLAGPQLWLIYVVMTGCAIIGMGFQAAYVTAVVNLVETEQITVANSMLQGTLALTYVLGPLLAGIVVAVLSPTVAVGVDALSFGISMLSLTCIRFRPSPSTSTNTLPPQEIKASDCASEGQPWLTASSLRKGCVQPLELERFPRRQGLDKLPVQTSALRSTCLELLAGFRYLWRHPLLRSVMLLSTGVAAILLSGGASGILDLFIFHLIHDLHQPQTAVGLVFGIASIGGIAGSLLAPMVRRHLGFGRCYLGGIALAGLATIGAGLAPTSVSVAPFAVLFIFGSTLGSICVLSLQQELTPNMLLGRVSSAFATASTIVNAVGAILITDFAHALGMWWISLLAGGWVIGLVVLGCFMSGVLGTL